MSKMSQLSADIDEIKATMQKMEMSLSFTKESLSLQADFVRQAFELLPTLISVAESKTDLVISKEDSAQQAYAWRKVWETLEKVSPELMGIHSTGTETACLAIETLAEGYKKSKSRQILDGQWEAPEKRHNEDFSCRVQELGMYSYDRPSNILWNVVMNLLMQKGFSQGAAEQWLRSKAPRWALDGKLGNMLEEVAYEFTTKHAESYFDKAQCEEWAAEAAKE